MAVSEFKLNTMATVGSLTVMLTLLACSTVPQTVDVKITCPAVKQYTPGQDQDLLHAYQSLPAGSPLRSAMMDYKALRDGLRACQGTGNLSTPSWMPVGATK